MWIKIMVWIWVIIAVIVIAGLLFWVKSGNKEDSEADQSVDAEEPVSSVDEPEVSVETPEPPVETPAEPEEPEVLEEPKQEEAVSSDEEDKMVWIAL